MRWHLALALFTALGLGAGGAAAAPITVTVQATASGALGASSFSGALVTLTAQADTADRLCSAPSFCYYDNVPATVEVAGLGSAAFSVPIRVFVNQVTQVAGFSQINISDILNVGNAGFAAYAFATDFGPVSGAPAINAGTLFATNLGDFVLASTTGDGTFLAVVTEPGAVPAPAALPLLGLGLLVLAGVVRRRP